ncbi:MAG: tRNA (adenosine(37)-N6)-threonylcarbamoyltransferase complex dimerization subunit type 1 TsaB [Deltaproteobacteria bacterium RBG_13_60_28]|nr:MAG: tRNA (adenosine(37)-N6)-threonylcarbamoyltransferase complex dimerization subunit type 1 TsaB [Deltaproteobacteria bacterium RBG_13_60_28]
MRPSLNNPLVLLALDTATEKGSLALAENDRLLGEYFLHSPGTYLQRLLPTLDELLRATGRSLKGVGAIAVSQGPGNFTGLRIGLATAKGLAWALSCPLVPVPTLEALAAPFPYQPHPVAVLMDAKREEVYLGLFNCQGELPQPLTEPQRLPVTALPSRLQPPMLLTGPGLNAYGDFLEKHLPPEISWAPPEMRHPRAATIARLGKFRLEQGLTASPQQLTPSYLRPAL